VLGIQHRRVTVARVVEQADAYEVVAGGEGRARVLLTCEHASNRLPEGWHWPDEDRWLVNTHWAIDLGIAQITRALADELGATAVLSRFSRLIVDPNRPVGSDSQFRLVADGRDVALNLNLDPAERAHRIERLYDPFHGAIERQLRQHEGSLVLSLHSFTPVYENSPARWMELGILFDREDALARRLAPCIKRQGLMVALNEPYTGKGGMMYSAQSHADRTGRRALEIEIRQDRATNPAYRQRLVTALADMTRQALDITG
jgi:predicted N-formylglutamate amidohydrolase